MENKEIKKEVVKKVRSYKTKDLVFVAIIAFLIGAIITATGFTIYNKSRGKEDFRNFKQDGVQRNIGPNGLDGEQGQTNNPNNNGLNKQRPDRNNPNASSEPNNQSQSNDQNTSNEQNNIS